MGSVVYVIVTLHRCVTYTYFFYVVNTNARRYRNIYAYILATYTVASNVYSSCILLSYLLSAD